MEVLGILAIVVPFVSFFAFLCTIITAYHSLQYRNLVEDAENQVMDLLDEALKIMIPTGICKRISIVHSMAVDSCDSKITVIKQNTILPEVEYPEDLSAALANEEEIYREFGAQHDEMNFETTSHAEVQLAIRGTHKLIGSGFRLAESKTKLQVSGFRILRSKKKKAGNVSEGESTGSLKDRPVKTCNTDTKVLEIAETPLSTSDTQEDVDSQLMEKYSEKTCIDEDIRLSRRVLT
ncbi:hypothetical protein V3C99_015217 [Haemonchus contortus]